MATDSFDVQSLPWADIRLGSMDSVPLERLQVWQNDPTMRDLTMGFRFPVSKEATRGWLEAKQAQNGRTSVTFAILCRDVAVGFVFLNDLDWLHRRATVGTYVGDPKQAVKGTGTCAKALVFDYAFRSLGLNRVLSNFVASNEATRKINQRLGMRQEGVLRDYYFVSGGFVDVVQMGILAAEFDIDFPNCAHRQ